MHPPESRLLLAYALPPILLNVNSLSLNNLTRTASGPERGTKIETEVVTIADTEVHFGLRQSDRVADRDY